MSGPVGRGARWGMIVGAFLASAFTYYDIVANHKNMFGFAPVFVAFFAGGLFGAVFGHRCRRRQSNESTATGGPGRNEVMRDACKILLRSIPPRRSVADGKRSKKA